VFRVKASEPSEAEQGREAWEAKVAQKKCIAQREGVWVNRVASLTRPRTAAPHRLAPHQHPSFRHGSNGTSFRQPRRSLHVIGEELCLSWVG